MTKSNRPKRMVDRPTLAGRLGENGVQVFGSAHTYHVGPRVWTTALCEWYTARYDATLGVLKLPKDSDDNAALEHEAAVLKSLENLPFGRHCFPTLVESLPLKNAENRKQGNVLALQGMTGLYSLQEIHAAHPVLDPRDVAWMVNRLWEAMSFYHGAGLVHGAILPPHVFYDIRSHGIQLCEWNYATRAPGQHIAMIDDGYEPWYPPEVLRKRPATPATDICMAARCAVLLLGGDPVTGRMPDNVDPTLRGFFQVCLLESPHRPADAGAMRESFGEILQTLYGKRTFRSLAMPARA